MADGVTQVHIHCPAAYWSTLRVNYCLPHVYQTTLLATERLKVTHSRFSYLSCENIFDKFSYYKGSFIPTNGSKFLMKCGWFIRRNARCQYNRININSDPLICISTRDKKLRYGSSIGETAPILHPYRYGTVLLTVRSHTTCHTP